MEWSSGQSKDERDAGCPNAAWARMERLERGQSEDGQGMGAQA